MANLKQYTQYKAYKNLIPSGSEISGSFHLHDLVSSVLTTCVTALHLHHYPSMTDMCTTNMGHISLLGFQAPFDLQKKHC